MIRGCENHVGWMMRFGFPASVRSATVRGIFGDPKARILRLLRRGKKRPAEHVGGDSEPSTTARPVEYATSLVATPGCTWRSRSGACTAGAAAP